MELIDGLHSLRDVQYVIIYIKKNALMKQILDSSN